MALPLQTKHTLVPITTNIPRIHHCPSLLRLRLTCSIATNITNSHHHDHNKLVVEKRHVKPSLSNYQSLQSTWTHRLWVATGCTTVFASFAKSIIGGIRSQLWLQPALAGCVGYILADLSSGIYHWAIDNYGDESTPLIGAQIKDAQGHHKWPWTITKRQFANNSHALARGVTLMVIPLVLAFNDPMVHGFVSTFAFCILFCQQFHAWAHGSKSKLPPLVVALQDRGILLSRRQHVNHHRPSSYNCYCIVSGAWNRVLDEGKVFVTFENVLYSRLGVRPRSWNDINSEWIEEETDIANNKA